MDESPETLRRTARQWLELSKKTPFARLRRDYTEKALWFALLAEHQLREEQRLAATGVRSAEAVPSGSQGCD
jgi:hypothetical protein